jgi:hypothetical protein
MATTNALRPTPRPSMFSGKMNRMSAVLTLITAAAPSNARATTSEGKDHANPARQRRQRKKYETCFLRNWNLPELPRILERMKHPLRANTLELEQHLLSPMSRARPALCRTNGRGG